MATIAKFCLLFSLVVCTVRAAPQNSDSPPTSGTDDSAPLPCPERNGQFKHPQYCDQFINCWEGVGVVGKCEHGLNFNPTTSTCDYPDRVNCDGTQDSRPQMDEGVCPGGYGTFPNSDHCGQFIICHAGYVHVFNCPPTTVYNSTLGVCDHAAPEETCLKDHPEMQPTPSEVEGPPPAIGPMPNPTPGEMPTSRIPDFDFATAMPAFPSGPDGSNPNNPILFPVFPSWPKVTNYSVMKCPEGHSMGVVPAIPAYAVCVKNSSAKF